MQKYLVLVGAVVLVVFYVAARHQPVASTDNSTPDVSWPNCTLQLAPEQAGIVGINDGIAFTHNPCFVREALNYKFLSIYLNTAYPGISYGRKYARSPSHCSANNNLCLAYNYGFNIGLEAINSSLRDGIVAKRWWLDVETDNSWVSSVRVNRAALSGIFAAVSRYAGTNQTGYYSSPHQWSVLTGNWHNGAPAWLATGSTNELVAQAACHFQSFTGGSILLTQYTPSLDQNYLCN